jgi:hypothetical protein
VCFIQHSRRLPCGLSLVRSSLLSSSLPFTFDLFLRSKVWGGSRPSLITVTACRPSLHVLHHQKTSSSLIVRVLSSLSIICCFLPHFRLSFLSEMVLWYSHIILSLSSPSSLSFSPRTSHDSLDSLLTYLLRLPFT